MADANFQRVADAIREQIRTGVLRPGDQLPSTAQLRDEHGVGAGAVREAVLLLVSERLIETRPGKGRYVAAPSIDR